VPDPILIILFFVFIVLPLIERAMKKRQPPQPPEQQQPRPLPHPEERAARERAGLPGRAERPESAADMVPDDLWEILTGERRPGAPLPQPRPQEHAPPEPERGADEWFSHIEPESEDIGEEEFYTDAIGLDAEEEWERLGRERQRAVHSVEHAAPHVPLTARERATRMRVLSAEAERGPIRVRPGPMLGRLRLRERDELRRALVLKEILGRPKGLE
jgi:hypothetical protein